MVAAYGEFISKYPIDRLRYCLLNPTAECLNSTRDDVLVKHQTIGLRSGPKLIFDLYNLYISTFKLQICQQLFQDGDPAYKSGLSKQDAFGFKCGSDFIGTYPGLCHPLIPDCLQDCGDEESYREELLFWKIWKLKPE
jgi:hypothetical protein